MRCFATPIDAAMLVVLMLPYAITRCCRLRALMRFAMMLSAVDATREREVIIIVTPFKSRWRVMMTMFIMLMAAAVLPCLCARR